MLVVIRFANVAAIKCARFGGRAGRRAEALVFMEPGAIPA